LTISLGDAIYRQPFNPASPAGASPLSEERALLSEQTEQHENAESDKTSWIGACRERQKMAQADDTSYGAWDDPSGTLVEQLLTSRHVAIPPAWHILLSSMGE